MSEAAVALLASLHGDQRSIAQWPFGDVAERTRWFYTPTDHGGLPLSAMDAGQQRLAHQLVRSGLSAGGYGTVTTIIGLENVLGANEGWRVTVGRQRGRDPGLYFVRVFGDPGGAEPWAWRFGGHHVSAQHVIVDGAVVGSTPSFLGADPASSPLLGPHPLRPLAGAEDLGRQLARSLDDEQLAGALLAPVAPVDIVGGNRVRLSDGDPPLTMAETWRQRFAGADLERFERAQVAVEGRAGLTASHLDALRLTAAAKGLGAGALRPDQRDILRALLDVYVHRLPDDLADDEAAKYADDGDLAELSFAWAGGLEPADGHYYRVQGSVLLVEYDNSQNNANHVHTVWRDLRRDFGGSGLRGYPADPLRAHLTDSHP
ncbi:MAG: DUF3500 domain-containing protein [Ilumatobacteraceae bacterium]